MTRLSGCATRPTTKATAREHAHAAALKPVMPVLAQVIGNAMQQRVLLPADADICYSQALSYAICKLCRWVFPWDVQCSSLFATMALLIMQGPCQYAL